MLVHNANFDPKIRTKKHPGFCKLLRQYFNDFLNNTSLHGLKYMSGDRTMVERFCWLTIFCISLSVCAILIINIWTKWEQSPILLNFAPNPTPLSQIAFPAVTICLGHNVNSRKFDFPYHFEKYFKKNLTHEERTNFCYAVLNCPYYHYPTNEKFCEDADDDAVLTRLLANMVPHEDEVLDWCQWKRVTEKCTSLFSRIITNLGFCFTFNMLNRSELFTENFYMPHHTYCQQEQISGWDADDGYIETNQSETFPKRVVFASSRNSVEFMVLKYPGEKCNQSREKGIQVLLHHPAEFPRGGIVGSHLLTLPYNKTIDVVIKPENIMTSSADLKTLKLHRKKCSHAKDRSLQFFKIYTRQNCLTECIANYTLSKLGCIPYYMPHKNSTKICTNNVDSYLLEEDLHKDKHSLFKCDCLPSCNSVNYNAKTTETSLSGLRFAMPPNNGYSYLRLFFEDMEFTAVERKELFSTTDFWANCGGLLGLFIGFSFLSFVEIIYFITLRLVCNIKNYGRHYWSGSKQND